MRPVALLFLTLLPLSAPAAGGTGPTPYPGEKDTAAWPGQGPIRVFNWMTDNRNHFWTRREKDQGSIVFVGDSLTGGLKADLVTRNLPGMKIANRGIGGDVSRGVLFRLQEDVLDLKPTQIVLCIGTNDLSTHAKPEVIVSNISLILDQIQKSNPKVPVILCTIPPRANPKAPLKNETDVVDLNTQIKALAKENVIVVDLYSVLATPEGKPDPALFNEDQLHLNAAGGQKWLETIRPVLEKNAAK